MTVGQFEVVPAGTVKPGQSVGKIALFNEDGTPWEGGGGEPVAVAWGDITGKPATFTPATHTHTIAQIDGLQAALDAKADAA